MFSSGEGGSAGLGSARTGASCEGTERASTVNTLCCVQRWSSCLERSDSVALKSVQRRRAEGFFFLSTSVGEKCGAMIQPSTSWGVFFFLSGCHVGLRRLNAASFYTRVNRRESMGWLKQISRFSIPAQICSRAALSSFFLTHRRRAGGSQGSPRMNAPQATAAVSFCPSQSPLCCSVDVLSEK